jgi:hypothetical protein
MWISNSCYLFFSIKNSVITQMRLLPNTWNNRIEKKKTLMIYYSFSIYTTDKAGDDSSVINIDELLIKCSISWMTNESEYTCFLIHCLRSISLLRWPVDRFVSRYTHVCVYVCWHLIGLKRACRAESSVLYTGRRDWTAISFQCMHSKMAFTKQKR